MAVLNKTAWGIRDIEAITEDTAREIAKSVEIIKGHTVYFADLGECFGFSCLVFLNGGHLYHANDYQLHHRCVKHRALKKLYMNGLESKLFTEEEIAMPLKSYDEYKRKSDYLHNYYGMQKEYVSIFRISSGKESDEEFDRKTRDFHYNPVCFGFMDDEEFIAHHMELLAKLERQKDSMKTDYEYLKGAFLSEMYNHEYCINWQADFDTLSAFGNIRACSPDDTIDMYFEELGFNEIQKRAYFDARREYYDELE